MTLKQKSFTTRICYKKKLKMRIIRISKKQSYDNEVE